MITFSFFSATSFTTYRMKKWGWYLLIFGVLLWGVWFCRGFRWEIVLRNLPFLLKGMVNSWKLALISCSIGMVAAIFLSAARLYGPAGVRHIAIAFIEIIRAIPQLMIIFWVYFTFPGITGKTVSSWSAAIISLSLIAAAYLAEVVRAGLTSVPRIQNESAYVTGLNSRQTFIFIVLPQALRNMLPALIAQFVSLFKTTSLVWVIGLIEFFRASVLVNNRDVAPYALYITMAGGYFLCCYTLSSLVRKIDPKYKLTTS